MPAPLGFAARQHLVARLRRTLAALDRGDLRIHGEGHSLEQGARIQAKIEALEGGNRRRDHAA